MGAHARCACGLWSRALPHLPPRSMSGRTCGRMCRHCTNSASVRSITTASLVSLTERSAHFARAKRPSACLWRRRRFPLARAIARPVSPAFNNSQRPLNSGRCEFKSSPDDATGALGRSGDCDCVAPASPGGWASSGTRRLSMESATGLRKGRRAAGMRARTGTWRTTRLAVETSRLFGRPPQPRVIGPGESSPTPCFKRARFASWGPVSPTGRLASWRLCPPDGTGTPSCAVRTRSRMLKEPCSSGPVNSSHPPCRLNKLSVQRFDAAAQGQRRTIPSAVSLC